MSESRVLVEHAQARRFAVDQAMTITEYFTGSDQAEVSLVTGALDGEHGRRRNWGSVKLYYVLSGELSMVVDGRTYDLHANDALLVRPGEVHAMEGRDSKIIIICAPPFDAADETIEE